MMQMGLLLNIIASILKWIFQPICWAVGAIVSIRKREFFQWNEDIAYTKDVYGNVLMKYVANYVLIKKESQHKFGNKKQTISAVIGLNKHNYTLAYWGMVIDGVLEFFDPGHSLAAAGVLRFKVVIDKEWYKTKVGWLYVSMAQVVLFGIIYQFPSMDWAFYPMVAGYIYPVALGVVLIAYAFIINPINHLNEKYRNESRKI
jgi:hypothetical protein